MFLSLFLCITIATALEIRNHIHGGIGMQEKISIENTLVASITRSLELKNGDSILEGIEYSLQRDGCSLTFSGSTTQQIVIKFYCDFLNNTAFQEKSPLPLLVGLEEYLMKHGYVVNHKEYLQVIRKPSAWDGSRKEKQQKLSEYFERIRYEASEEGRAKLREEKWRKKKYPELHGEAVENNAPWGLDRIDTRYGALDGSYYYDYLAEDVDIYVIDTGINVNHVEFEGRAIHLVNTVGDGINTDCNGHGTHVASIAGGKDWGVAKGVTLFGVKALDCAGNGDSFSIMTAAMAVIEHVDTRPNKRAIVSASLGGDYSSAINNAILTLVNNNIVTVVAAGNEQSDACSFSPSSLGQNSAVIVIGASDIDDGRPIYSNYGRCVTLSAPGHGITGANYASNTTAVIHSGTSMATPHASGVAAFILHQNMQLSAQEVKEKMVSWATPNVISGTSSLGGGKNLLYSLIDLEQDPPNNSPSPQQNTDFDFDQESSASSLQNPLILGLALWMALFSVLFVFV